MKRFFCGDCGPDGKVCEWAPKGEVWDCPMDKRCVAADFECDPHKAYREQKERAWKSERLAEGWYNSYISIRAVNESSAEEIARYAMHEGQVVLDQDGGIVFYDEHVALIHKLKKSRAESDARLNDVAASINKEAEYLRPGVGIIAHPNAPMNHFVPTLIAQVREDEEMAMQKLKEDTGKLVAGAESKVARIIDLVVEACENVAFGPPLKHDVHLAHHLLSVVGKDKK